MLETIFILLAVLAGVFMQRLAGFGMPIIVLPIILIFFQPTSALVLVLFTGILSSIVILQELRPKDKVDLKIIRILLPASIIGIVIGSYVLTIISKETLQIFLGLSIVIFLNLQRYFLPKPKGEMKIDGTVHFYGLLSGFFKTTVGLSAVPLLIWIRFYIVRSNQIRLLMSYYFLVMNTIAIAVIQILENTALTNIPIYVFLLIIPVVLLANHLGSVISDRLSEASYDKFVHVLLMMTGFLTLASGIYGIFN